MRAQQLASLSKAAGMDWFAIVPGPNLVYLTGLHMHVSERPIVALFPSNPRSKPALIVPSFEVGKAKSGRVSDWRIFDYKDGQSYQSAFDKAARALKLDGKKVGVEPHAMRFLELNYFQKSARKLKMADGGDVIRLLRLCKDAGEIAAVRKAIQISESVLARTLEEVKVGMSEREVAAMMSITAFKMGVQDVSFGPLVQVGKMSAFPHGGAGDTRIVKGDTLLIDFGYKHADYPADITRTFYVGEPSAEQRKIHELVKAANAAGRAAAKPGATGQDIDRATRKVIEDAGYGKYFTHRTGHGLGLEVHEAPYIVEGDTTVLKPGMLFTIEPGIYIEGVGGVRIEDNVVITESGADVLTSFSRDLNVIG